jgi:hypothetical protein
VGFEIAENETGLVGEQNQKRHPRDADADP